MDKETESYAFHKEKFKTLREEIARLDSAKRQLELFTVAAVAAITAWLFVHNVDIESNHLIIAWWMPCVCAILGYLQAQAYVRRSLQVGRYVMRLEKIFDPKELGWESFLDNERKTKPILKGRIVSGMTKVVWSFILVIFGALGIKFCGLSGFVMFVTFLSTAH